MSARIVGFVHRHLCRHLCHDCRHWIWPWQPRHRLGHSVCHHREMDRMYRRNLEAYSSLKPWDCNECGRLAR